MVVYKIGVLALQGDVSEHMRAIEAIGCEALAVKTTEQLEQLDALILPGGESSTMRKLMDASHLLEALRAFSKPLLGTCAGLILLADEVVGEEAHIGGLNIRVQRNSFGRQQQSFVTNLAVKDWTEPLEAIFIRAPHIVAVGENVEVLSRFQEKIVLVQQGNKIGCACHPELTSDLRIFLKLKALIV